LLTEERLTTIAGGKGPYLRNISESITAGNGNTMKATTIGNLNCDIEHINGKTFQAMIQDVKYVTEF
jgi:hypothetical protein